MPDGHDYTANLRKNAMRMAIVMLGLREFGALSLAFSLSGKPIGEDDLGRIQRRVVARVKEAKVIGFSEAEVAEIFRAGIEELRTSMRDAIERARKIEVE
jgi:hypothetical protein